MASQNFYSSDLDSPGFEYLRSYRAMDNLYFKLVALDYQKEFCPLYKCPPIHKFYFAIPSANQVEQQFSFICLCVWLIKDKCQMNFDTDPHEYQDLDSSVNVIFEALKLLLSSDERQIDERHLFPMGRLRQGYGPEVIYCLNRFADRALEKALEDNPKIGQVEIIYQNKQKGGRDKSQSANSIVIGQPIVGGGLTTRPLGNYQIDDASLILDYEESDTTSDDRAETYLNEAHRASEWDEDKLAKISQLFEIDHDEGKPAQDNWQDLLDSVKKSRREVEEFTRQSKPSLETVARRVEHEMQIVNSREATINTSLSSQIERFAAVWEDYCEQAKNNSELTEKINQKTDTFELYVQQLKELHSKEVKLDDESELEELKRLTKTLDKQRREMDLKLSLLLAAACRTGSSKR